MQIWNQFDEMKLFAVTLLVTAGLSLGAQDYTKRNFFWYIPSEDVIINGIGLGFAINGADYKQAKDTTTTIINGLCLELIGMGFFLPLAPGSPIYPNDTTSENFNLETEISHYQDPLHLVNGFAISSFGFAGHSIQINGVNLSGLFTFTSKVNGFSASLVFNISGISNGLSISGLGNNSLHTKGVQIGLFNQCWKLRGIQIGLLNKNEKRTLPLINWNFK